MRQHLDEGITGGGQKLDYQRVTIDHDGKRFRVRLHRDSYDFQSRGSVELWTPNGWTNVLSIPGQDDRMVALPTGYAAAHLSDKGVLDYRVLADDLLDIASVVTA